jgi:glutamate-1-semialdehyde 2,1-aminomutase
MGALAPAGPIYQAGTLSGNPLATAAGRATLEQLAPERYLELGERVGRLAEGLREAVASAGVAVQVPQVGTLLGIFFDEEPIHNFDEAKAAGANGRYSIFFNEMLASGISLAPSAYEAIFTSLAHSDSDILRTVEAAGKAAEVVARTDLGKSPLKVGEDMP